MAYKRPVEESKVMPAGLETLMREASEALVGLTQELRGSDVVEVSLFTSQD